MLFFDRQHGWKSPPQGRAQIDPVFPCHGVPHRSPQVPGPRGRRQGRQPLNAYVYVYVYAYVYVHVYVYAYVYVYVYVCVNKYIYIYTYIYTHII